LQTALQSHVAVVRQNFLSVFSEQELAQMAAFWRWVEEHQVNMT
jgi:hypothetical protein